jgi:CBS-domain-containing membrane protein/PII-like signaling protein
MTTPVSVHANAQRLTIYIGESDRWRGKPLYMVILETLRRLGLAGATVVRGVAGFGAHSRIHTASIERLSQDLPLRIEVVDDASKIALALEHIAPMVSEGMITLENVWVARYTHRYLNPLPADKPVSEVMKREVITLSPEMSVAQAWEIMLKHLLKALPVVDDQRNVVGMLTDEDLLCCTQSRPALADSIGSELVAEELQALRTSNAKVADVMVSPVITANDQESLGVVAARMAKYGLKRLPVVNEYGALVGVLSRRDVLQQVLDKAPVELPPSISLQAVQTVEEVMHRPIPTVKMDASLAEIVDTLLETGSRRVIVVDEASHPLGLISDGDVVTRVAPQEQKSVLAALRHLGRPPQSLSTAQSLMSPDVLTASPDTPLAEAAQRMLSEKRKWLVVVDADGKALGLVDRQILLKALAG